MTTDTNTQPAAAPVTITVNPAPAGELWLHTSKASAAADPAATTSKMVQHSFKQPARQVFINVPIAVFDSLSDCPTQYRALLEAVYIQACKDLISAYLKEYSIWPSSMPESALSLEAIRDQAAGNNSNWMDKTTLEAAWDKSTTLRNWQSRPDWKTNRALRTQVTEFSDDIKKLAGKGAKLLPERIDFLLSKLHEDDLSSDLGAFIVPRLEAIRKAMISEAAKTGDLL